MRRVACVIVVALLGALACGCTKEKKPKEQPRAGESAAAEGTPLFADETWKKDPKQTFESLMSLLGPDWHVATAAIELESESQLAVRGLRIESADGKSVLAFEQLEVRGTDRDLQLTARLPGGGSAEARVRMAPSLIEADVELDGVRVGEDNGWRVAAGGVPLRGSFDARVSLRMPERSWAKATGAIELACKSCGTAEGKIYPPAPRGGGASASAFAASGLTVPALLLGDLMFRLKLDQGTGTIELATAGDADLTLAMRGDLRIADPLGRSSVKACIRVSLSPETRHSSPTLDGMFTLLSRAGDATASMSLSGQLDSPRVRPVQSCE